MNHIPTVQTYFDNRDDLMLIRESSLFFNCDYDEEFKNCPSVLLSELRTLAQDSERIHSKKTFLCGCCKRPLKICGGGVNQLHFRHISTPEENECDYYEGVHYSEADIKAMIFNGRTEGKEHRRIKAIIQQALLNELPNDKVFVEEIAKKVGPTWRKPDIRAVYEDKIVVFEVQLSPLFLHVILDRNSAYRNNGWFICWIFDDISTEKNLLRIKDAWVNNNYNIFTFDKAAEKATIESGKLHLTVKYSRFAVDESDKESDPILSTRWETETIPFSELTFDKESQMVFRYDSGKEKCECESIIRIKKEELEQVRQEKQEQEQRRSRLNKLIWTQPKYPFQDTDYDLFIEYAEDLDYEEIDMISSEVLYTIESFDFVALNRWLSVYCDLKKSNISNKDKDKIDKTLNSLWNVIIKKARETNKKIDYVTLSDFLNVGSIDDFNKVLYFLSKPFDEEFSIYVDNLPHEDAKLELYAPLILLNRYYKHNNKYIPPRILHFFNEYRNGVKYLISARMGKPFGTGFTNLKQVANEVWKSCRGISHLFIYLIDKYNFTSEINVDKVKSGKESINHYKRLTDYIQSFPNELTTDLRVEDFDVIFPRKDQNGIT